MDAFMLDGWTPISLLGIIFGFVLFIISRKVSRKVIFFISAGLSFICIGMIAYSVVVVRGWEGMGIGVITITILIGIWIGTILGVMNKK